MKFSSRHIHGAGRGKGLGFPTINLEIPDSFALDTGIYAVWVTIGKSILPGAMHFGPVPSFGDPSLHLEIYILDCAFKGAVDLIDDLIGIAVVKRIRSIKKFDNSRSLKDKISDDVVRVREILSLVE